VKDYGKWSLLVYYYEMERRRLFDESRLMLWVRANTGFEFWLLTMLC
jgi:hypothetical protein